MRSPIRDLVVDALSDSTEIHGRGFKCEDGEAQLFGKQRIGDTRIKVVEQHTIENGPVRLTLKSGSKEIVGRVAAGFPILIWPVFGSSEQLSQHCNFPNKLRAGRQGRMIALIDPVWIAVKLRFRCAGLAMASRRICEKI